MILLQCTCTCTFYVQAKSLLTYAIDIHARILSSRKYSTCSCIYLAPIAEQKYHILAQRHMRAIEWNIGAGENLTQ
jgi:hypothetical protein